MAGSDLRRFRPLEFVVLLGRDRAVTAYQRSALVSSVEHIGEDGHLRLSQQDLADKVGTNRTRLRQIWSEPAVLRYVERIEQTARTFDVWFRVGMHRDELPRYVSLRDRGLGDRGERDARGLDMRLSLKRLRQGEVEETATETEVAPSGPNDGRATEPEEAPSPSRKRLTDGDGSGSPSALLAPSALSFSVTIEATGVVGRGALTDIAAARTVRDLARWYNDEGGYEVTQSDLAVLYAYQAKRAELSQPPKGWKGS